MRDSKHYWVGGVPGTDDFGEEIVDEFVDGRVMYTTSWAFMSPKTFKVRGIGLGTGKGQRYKKQSDGKWLKVEG